MNKTNYTIALIGNPNCGKTTIFNALTGMNQKVGNYPGVTVEKVIGHYIDSKKNKVDVIDLPGTYSLTAMSPDEKIARDTILGKQESNIKIDVIVVVLDACSLERNLYLATQALELGKPVVFALNMFDEAEKQGKNIEIRRLSACLNSDVIPTVGIRSKGISLLKETIRNALSQEVTSGVIKLNLEINTSIKKVGSFLQNKLNYSNAMKSAEALRLIGSDENRLKGIDFLVAADLNELIQSERIRLAKLGINWSSAEAEARYNFAQKTVNTCMVVKKLSDQLSFTEAVDSILLHKVWGPLIFVALMLLIFQSVFTWATPIMNLIEVLVEWLKTIIGNSIQNDSIRSLVVDGIISGVGGVVLFLPQILILFMYISILERTGYMARIAFIMDRLMSKMGLHGKSFVPMLSGFACSIPGIMACRTIENWRDRLVTILVIPLITCSARLPVYILLIALFVPKTKYGPFALQGLVMSAMYFLGIFGAMITALILKSTLFKSKSPPLLLELPSYKTPMIQDIAMDLFQRGGSFLTKAGTVILGLSVILWGLLHYPQVEPPSILPTDVENNIELRLAELVKSDPSINMETAKKDLTKHWIEEYKLTHSYAGYLGKAIEPIIAPLGFNWKIGVGLIASFAAREVFVSTMSIVYGLGDNSDQNSNQLVDHMQNDKKANGEQTFSPLVALSLLVFFAFSMQCLATLTIVYRESNSWIWPTLQITYTTALAWLSSFSVYQIGKILGF